MRAVCVSSVRKNCASIGHARGADREITSIEIEANTRYPADTLPALRSSGRSIVEKGSVLMPCDKATYRTHRTKPTPKPANGAALRIMPLPGRMSSSHCEFRKRSLQLNACGQALRAAQCAATGNAAKKDNQPKTFGAPRPTRGRPQCDVFTRSL